MSHTAIRRILEVGRFQNRQKGLHGTAMATSAAVFEAYHAQLTMARMSTHLTLRIVGMALIT
jgi:hypothetical protein